MSYSSAPEALLNLCPLKCQNPMVMTPGWLAEVSVSHAASCLGCNNYAAGKAVQSRTQCLCTAGRMKRGDHRKWGPDFPNIHCWTFLELQVTQILVAEVGRTFIGVQGILPDCLHQGDSSSACASIPTVKERGWEGCALIQPYGYFFFFLLSGEFMLHSLNPPGDSVRACQGNPVLCCQQCHSRNAHVHQAKKGTWAIVDCVSSGLSPPWLLRPATPVSRLWPSSSHKLPSARSDPALDHQDICPRLGLKAEQKCLSDQILYEF